MQTVIEKQLLTLDLVKPKPNEVFQAFQQSHKRMSPQDQQTKSQSLENNTDFHDCTSQSTTSVGAKPGRVYTPIKRWESEKVEEQPWNTLAAASQYYVGQTERYFKQGETSKESRSESVEKEP